MSLVTEKTLVARIARLRQALLDLGDMRPGSLSQQSRQKDGVAYGHYWHLNYTFRGKARTHYVPSDCVDQVQLEIENFRKFRELTDELIETSIALSEHRIKSARAQSKMKPRR